MAVNWSKLKNCYGNNSVNIPIQICNLSHQEHTIREEALKYLYNFLCHQGSTSEASVYAIPFLLDLTSSSNTPDRDRIVFFLVDLALRFRRDYVPNGIDITAFRSKASDIEISCYNALQVGVPELIQLLQEDDKALTSSVIYALAWFPENAKQSLPILKRLLTKTSSPDEISNLIFTIGILDPWSWKELNSFLLHDSPSFRASSAISLAKNFLSPNIIEILGDTVLYLEDRITLDHEWEWHYCNSIEDYVDLIFARIGICKRQEIVSLLSEELEFYRSYDYKLSDVATFVKKQIYENVRQFHNPAQLSFNFEQKNL